MEKAISFCVHKFTCPAILLQSQTALSLTSDSILAFRTIRKIIRLLSAGVEPVFWVAIKQLSSWFRQPITKSIVFMNSKAQLPSFFCVIFGLSLYCPMAFGNFNNSGSMEEKQGTYLKNFTVALPRVANAVSSHPESNIWGKSNGLAFYPNNNPKSTFSFVKGQKLYLKIQQGPKHVVVSVFDILGNPIAKVFDEQIPNGIFSIIPLNLVKGELTQTIYFIKVEADSRTEMWKVINDSAPD